MLVPGSCECVRANSTLQPMMIDTPALSQRADLLDTSAMRHTPPSQDRRLALLAVLAYLRRIKPLADGAAGLDGKCRHSFRRSQDDFLSACKETISTVAGTLALPSNSWLKAPFAQASTVLRDLRGFGLLRRRRRPAGVHYASFHQGLLGQASRPRESIYTT